MAKFKNDNPIKRLNQQINMNATEYFFCKVAHWDSSGVQYDDKVKPFNAWDGVNNGATTTNNEILRIFTFKEIILYI